MLKEIFVFELKYRSKRAATFIFFGIVFLLCFITVTSDGVKTGGAMGTINQNAPYVLSMLTLVVSIFLCLVASAIMGVAVLRDFEHNTEAIIFTKPIRKTAYLMGRFWGSFAVLLLIASGSCLAFLLGDLMWWRDQSRLMPIAPWNYLQPFLIFCVPNLFVSGALLFMNGTLTRQPIAIYTQGIFLLVLYLVSQTLLQTIEQRELAAVLDPFGLQAFVYETQYWTPSEKNASLVPLTGYFLYNRLIWVGVGIVALVVTHYFFSFQVSNKARKEGAMEETAPVKAGPAMQQIRKKFTPYTDLMQGFQMTRLYFVSIVKEVPFLGIVISGILLLFLNAMKLGEMYGTRSHATTQQVASLITSNFGLFLFILIIFYAGELVWKERSIRFDLIRDSLPVSTINSLLAKLAALVAVICSLLIVLIFCGVSIQVAYGYYNFEPDVYLTILFADTFMTAVLYTLVALFVQVMVNNKFLGYFVCVTFLVAVSLLDEMGIEHGLLVFSSGALGAYSDMNRFGHFVHPFLAFKSYWLALCLIVFALSVIFAVRGSEAAMALRWKAGRSRLNGKLKAFILCGCVLFVATGFYIFYNTNILNSYRDSDEQKQLRARYEKDYKDMATVAQPRVVEVKLNLDLYPSKRSFTASGYYYLKNKSEGSIGDIHVQHSIDDQLSVEKLVFDRTATLTHADDLFQYYVYALNEPLLPGDSVRMDFKISFQPQGFKEKNSNTEVVYNGTFLHNTSFLPTLGYNREYELDDDDDRKRYGLSKSEGMPDEHDPDARIKNLLSDDADYIRFEAIVSTSPDQTALAPGRLEKEWEADGRKVFHYKMDVPMVNFFSISSGRYAVRRDSVRNIGLEIYYHPAHSYNIDRMMEAMKDALAYYSENYSEYQFRQLRIVEFPRYRTFAQSFANTISYSEAIGFVAKVNDPDKDIDYPYYVTAHEVAHQWWGHQVIPARMKGGSMLSEGMSQYSALMVMKHSVPAETVQRYLKFELDGYLKGRASEKRGEDPLISSEGQHYINYNKSSLVFFALQDYIGEDNVNTAFREFSKNWRFRDGRYPSSADLIEHLRNVTPDSLKYLIHDMFETITLFENKTNAVKFKETDKATFEVTLNVSSEKVRSDSLGRETLIPVDDWIDLGVFAMEDGEEKLVYLQKHRITEKENTFVINVKQKPTRAGIDPLHKLIDRHSDDNTRVARAE